MTPNPFTEGTSKGMLGLPSTAAHFERPASHVPPNDDLKTHFSQLTDEELVIQLAEDRLTDEASQWAREELALRGVAVEQAVSNTLAARELAKSQHRNQQRNRSAKLRRILRFPIRALLGVESPWLVLVVGVVLAYPLLRITTTAISNLILLRPLPVYAVPLSYVVLGVFDLARLWFAVSLWRCAPRSDLTLVLCFMRIIGFGIGFGIVFSDMELVTLIRETAQQP